MLPMTPYPCLRLDLHFFIFCVFFIKQSAKIAKMEESEINDELLEDLYRWIDEIPLSRTKRDMRRDFSDAGFK